MAKIKLIPRRAVHSVIAALCFGGFSASLSAQTFNSGSDGSDGAMLIAANQGTIVFDPRDTARWGIVLDADGDGVYNFTTVTIGAGSTVKLRGDVLNRPVYWLASGSVVIDGVVDVSGNHGSRTVGDLSLRRQVALPGSGGYAGGAGGAASVQATAGDGPGGGSSVSCGGPGQQCGRRGDVSTNRYLIPLVGGSGGGGGGGDFGPLNWDGGGAGGGAVLIASSTSITVNGSVVANGGSGVGGGYGAGGAGGGIRLVAATLSGTGVLNVSGGASGSRQPQPFNNEVGSPGFVRLESFVGGSTFQLPAGGAFVTRGTPVDSSTLRPSSSLRVTAIDGFPVENSSGSFVVPDVTIGKATPVNVQILAEGVPHGTIVTLQVFPDSPTDPALIYLPQAQAALSGTLQSSTATISFTFPYGFSRGVVRATWTQ